MAARALLIEVRWPEGRFHGVGENRTGGREVVTPEWPPSPFRLFQALVAGAYGGRWVAEAAHDKDAAFTWLERQGPPVIVAPPKQALASVTYFVPNNDLDTREGDPARVGEIRSAKTLRGSLFDPDHPVAYLWRFDGEDVGASQIADLAGRMHILGHGRDAAFAHAQVLAAEAAEARLAELAGAVLTPSHGALDPKEFALACPASGSLASLQRRHAAFALRLEPVGRGRRAGALFRQPPKAHARRVAYKRRPLHLVFELRALQGTAAFAPWPLAQVQGLTLAVRDLLAARLGGEDDARVERYVIGRGAGPADASQRLRILPLPSIGATYTDPAIRRIVVELPPDCPVTSEEVAWALAGQNLRAFDPKTGEIKDRDEGEAGRGHLLVPAADLTMLRHYGWDGPSARTWRTVTPAALPQAASRRRLDPNRLIDTSPGEAKGGTERAEEESRAADAVVRALRHVNVGTAVAGIRVQREPFERKQSRAEAFAGGRFARDRLWHVEVAFDAPVAGPLAIGDGRFCGLGLMAPERRTLAQDLFGFEISSDRPVDAADRPELLQAVRRALMGRAGETSALPLFSGHAPDGSPARSGHHRHAYLALTDDPLVLWVAAPWRVDRSWRPAAEEQRGFTAVVDGLSRVRAGRLGLLTLRRRAQDADRLCGPSAVWSSLTPYRLDHHPARGEDIGQAAIGDLAAACLRLSLPRPQVHLVKVQGLSVLAQLTFSRRILGPLLIGRDAHKGGGLFVPAPVASKAD